MTAQKTGAGKVGIAALIIAIAAPLVLYYEGTIKRTYRDPIGIITACTGHTGPELRMGQTFTKAQCDALLRDDLIKHFEGIQPCIKRELKPNEQAALLSFAFNVGVSATCKSSLVRMLNAGEPAAVWCAQLKRWVYAGGKKLNGLVKRREAEYQMCIQ